MELSFAGTYMGPKDLINEGIPEKEDVNIISEVLDTMKDNVEEIVVNEIIKEIETPHLETIDINKKNKEQLLGIFFTQEEICGGYFNCSNGQKKIEAPSIPPFCIININEDSILNGYDIKLGGVITQINGVDVTLRSFKDLVKSSKDINITINWSYSNYLFNYLKKDEIEFVYEEIH